MKTDSGSQFCGSRGNRSPRSRMRMRAPVGARAVAMEPPPIPEPMMTTSWSFIPRPRFRAAGLAPSPQRLLEGLPHHVLVRLLPRPHDDVQRRLVDEHVHTALPAEPAAVRLPQEGRERRVGDHVLDVDALPD